MLRTRRGAIVGLMMMKHSWRPEWDGGVYFLLSPALLALINSLTDECYPSAIDTQRDIIVVTGCIIPATTELE